HVSYCVNGLRSIADGLLLHVGPPHGLLQIVAAAGCGIGRLLLQTVLLAAANSPARWAAKVGSWLLLAYYWAEYWTLRRVSLRHEPLILCECESLIGLIMGCIIADEVGLMLMADDAATSIL
ncbi:hypothetical protein Dimus_020043, partial [Dionaea muscipula]